MKSLKGSFLFFCFCILSVSQAFGVVVKQKDSLNYYYGIVVHPDNFTDLDKAYIYFENLKNDRLRNKDTLYAISCLRYIAEIQNKLGFIYESEATGVEALFLLDKFSGKDTLIEPRVGIYNHFGMLYRQQKDYLGAIRYYEKVMELAENEDHYFVAMGNKASAYKDMQDYQASFDEYKKVYDYALKKGDSSKIARALGNLGWVEAKLNRPIGLSHMREALDIRKRINNTGGIITSYIDLIQYYSSIGQLDLAREISEKARLLAEKSGNPKWIGPVLSEIVNLKSDKDIIRFKRYTDSINDAKQLQRNKYASAKYNFVEQEKKTQQSELFRLKEKSRRITYQFIGLFTFLLGLFSIGYLKMRHRKKILAEVNETEAKISRKVHDELANSIYKIMTVVQTNGQPKEEILNELDKVYLKTRDISKEIDMHDLNDQDDLMDILMDFKTENTNIIVKGLADVNWKDLKKSKKQTLAKILKELMVNMDKHSHATLVFIEFVKNGKAIQVVYKDNGVGCNLKKGTGLSNVENRIRMIRGSIIFESKPDQGFFVKMTL